MQLKGRVVLVTGGAKRVGRAIALTLARQGAPIAISFRSARREAQEAVEAFRQLGVEAVAFRADLSKASDVKKLVDAVQRRFGRLDVLVNCAANFDRVSFSKLSEKDWDHALDTNLKGPFLCSLYASRLMLKQKSGKIINIADWSGVKPYRNYLPYCVSKAGVIGLTKALAKELAPNIQVVAVAPGPVLAPGSMGKQDRKRVSQRVPLKHWGSPQDIANTILFLIEGTDFMTGSVVFVDGGQLIA